MDLTEAVPDGLQYLPDFITESDEQILIEQLSKLDWDGIGAFKRRGRIVKRKEIDFLHDYGRNNRQISEGLPLPKFLERLREDCAKAVGIEVESFQQVIASFYCPGAGIAWHVDSTDAFGDIICGLSLASNCKMHFGKEEIRNGKKQYKASSRILLPRRSLIVMQGLA